MLKEITIKNFKSINDEVTFSMEADYERVSEMDDHIINVNNNKLLKVASMYGPNGGGKSNILSAIQMIKNLVINNNVRVNYDKRKITCEFCNNDVISMTFFFVTDKYEIGYKFDVKYKITHQDAFDYSGNKYSYNIASLEVEYEALNYKTTDMNEFILLFERDNKGNIRSESLDKLNIKYSKIININLAALNYLYGTFVNIRNINSVELDVILNLYQEIYNIYDLEVTSVNYNVAFNAIAANKDRLIKLLNDVDIKINDIILNKNDKTSPIRFERIVNVNGNIEKRSIPLYEESKGTIKIFWMFVNLLNENLRSHIFICDDMNAYLHPKLYKAIIEIFNSKDNSDKQLIFNSHDIINMTNELFRRDEIWFVYRDDNYSTKLIPLSNIVNYKGEQVRKDAKYYKQYLEGRYGADPFIKKGLNWYE